MDFYPSKGCYGIVNPLADELESLPHAHQVSVNLTSDNVYSLWNYCYQARYLEIANVYSKPMVWIGIYIAVASMLCIIGMGADLWHGFRTKKMWFPSKYFTLNAASITVITVAMKLPVDLTSLMPRYVDQEAKLGSMAFMCTMMANLMPSLASMDNNTLLANVIGFTILVITIVVNICIEISTGAIENLEITIGTPYNYFTNTMIWAYIYVAMLLWLLIIMISSAITIPSSKQILEFKYQATDKITLDDQNKLTSVVEKLRLCVRRYWVMAESGSPQFVMASNRLSSISGIICVIILFMQLVIVLGFRYDGMYNKSDYKWSM